MNNEQFRKLIASNSSTPKNVTSTTPKVGGATPALGSRLKSSIPMTPRSLGGSKGGIDFRKQLAEQNAASQKARKFRTVAPKGSRLAEGYVDRTKERVDAEEDEKAKRIKALGEQMKLGQISEDVFVRARDAITGGDVSNTHLVKGLDFKLLERVRRGEDVLTSKAKEEEKEGEPVKDLDDEFEELDKNLEVAPVVREKVEKKGEMAPPPIAGQKRTRDQILAELKAQRQAAAQAKAEAMAPKLGKGFKKIGGPEEPRVEVDAKGREVLITTDAEGNIKRRVRKAPKQEQEIIPDKDAEVLGANVVVPEVPPPPPDSDDDADIFEDAGHDFNPLENLGSDSEEETTDSKPNPTPKPSAESDEEGEVPSRSNSRSTSPKLTSSTAPRNYFNDDPSTLSVLSNLKNDLTDPAVLAALAKTRNIDPTKLSSETETEEEAARRKRHAAMISRDDRDMEDMDMGFGSSRFDDAEEMAGDGERVKLSKWKGLKTLTGEDDEDDDGEGGGGGAKKKRKRGGGKRKGDKNDAGDVLKVMERLKK
ncbi:hypothetical protein FKW77_008389 [Venturia effusa]|uniref:RED-like N-terminal domain-containing protein n=1 Tax=Venturia effusa TaxID=50376 RepID=A0A517L7T8_9PEZI|nr:hypothetical protein FKW77_008389 [Venturia effusa]